ncbi:MAG: hypothetical protein R3A11_10025 [Bdellovibrionota bacterium]
MNAVKNAPLCLLGLLFLMVLANDVCAQNQAWLDDSGLVQIEESKFTEIKYLRRRMNTAQTKHETLEEIHGYINRLFSNPSYANESRVFLSAMHSISTDLDLNAPVGACSVEQKEKIAAIAQDFLENYSTLYLRSTTLENNHVGHATGYWTKRTESSDSALHVIMVPSSRDDTYTMDAYANHLLGAKRIEVRGNVRIRPESDGHLSLETETYGSYLQVEIDESCKANGRFRYRTDLFFDDEQKFSAHVTGVPDDLDQLKMIGLVFRDQDRRYGEELEQKIESLYQEIEAITLDFSRREADLKNEINEWTKKVQQLKEELQLLENLKELQKEVYEAKIEGLEMTIASIKMIYGSDIEEKAIHKLSVRGEKTEKKLLHRLEAINQVIGRMNNRRTKDKRVNDVRYNKLLKEKDELERILKILRTS